MSVLQSVYTRGLPDDIAGLLPLRVRGDIVGAAAVLPGIEELRLHAGRRATLTVAGDGRRMNIPTPAVLTQTEMENVLLLVCEGSLYAHRDTIARGYVSYKNGYRIGICGAAAVADGKIVGVSAPGTIAIRIPHAAPPVGAEICRLVDDMSYTRGVLIYSPPGVGKTTLVRSVAARLASGRDARRVAVVDERGELAAGLDGAGLCVDILAGYPKPRGIEIAARTLGAEVVICDEIGSRDDAEAVAAAQGCGVPLIATTHAGSIGELMGRQGIALLHGMGAFGAYVGIKRAHGKFDFLYEITPWEKVSGGA